METTSEFSISQSHGGRRCTKFASFHCDSSYHFWQERGPSKIALENISQEHQENLPIVVFS
jgi:hypothetical protein